MVRSAILFAAVAAGGAALGVDALSLRQHMENQMKTSGKSMTLERATGAGCVPEAVGKDERMCAASTSTSNNGKATCKDCGQTCHVWGDPHLAPFISDATVNVFSKPGNYTLWKWAGSGNDKTLDFTVEVKKMRSKLGDKPWIVSAALNGEILMTVDQCDENPDFNVHEKVPMSSDSVRGEGKEDMYIEYYVGCRFKHDIFALEQWIKVHDEDSPENAYISAGKQLGPYSLSTRMLKNDVGACVAWLTYGKNEKFDTPEEEEAAHTASLANDFNDGRTSSVKSSPGRTCVCSAECAIWGDPYVNSFYEANSRSNKKRNFQIPKSNVITQAQRVLYQVQNKYAVMVEMDKCELMSVVRVYIIKDSCLKKMESCNYNDATNPDWLDQSCYQEYVIDATEQCSDPANTAPKTRKTIQVPSQFADYGEDFYSATVNGFDAGLSVLDNDRLVPISSTNPDKCAKQLGVSSADEFVNMGGVRTIMKCHANVGGEFYFNVCIQREGLESQDGQGQPQDSSVKTMELQGRTSGWCATGDFLKGGEAATMSASAFTYREAGTTETFALATNEQ